MHIVFNNAGIAVGGPVLDMTHDDWRWVIDVDLWGPIHGVEAFLPRLVAQGEGGHVLFTASFAGLVPNRGLGPYCVAKYGVVALAEVLWRELREHGIGVSVLCPMRVGTHIGHSERNRSADYGGRPARRSSPDQDAGNEELAGRVLDVDGVAALTVDAIVANRLYVLPARGEPGLDPPPLRAHRPARSTSRPRPLPAVLRSVVPLSGSEERQKRQPAAAGVVAAVAAAAASRGPGRRSRRAAGSRAARG